jgi:hypothetical protein
METGEEVLYLTHVAECHVGHLTRTCLRRKFSLGDVHVTNSAISNMKNFYSCRQVLSLSPDSEYGRKLPALASPYYTPSQVTNLALGDMSRGVVGFFLGDMKHAR